MYPKLIPNNGYRCCPLGKLSHLGLEQLPSRSAWSYFHGPFNYDATPIGPLRCDKIAHKKIRTKHSWDFRGAAVWNVGVALKHYCCHTIVAKATRAAQVSDTLEFRHHHIT